MSTSSKSQTDPQVSAIGVIGDTTIDTIYEVDRLPGKNQTSRILSTKSHFGGKAPNICLAAKALASQTYLFTPVGSDFESLGYMDTLRSKGIDISHIVVSYDDKTSRYYLFRDRNGYTLSFFSPINIGYLDIIHNIQQFLNSIDLFHTAICDEKSQKSFLDLDLEKVTASLSEMVYEWSASTLLQTLTKTSMVFMNELELEFLLRRTAIPRITRFFQSNHRLKAIIVTSGVRGSTIYTRSQIHKIKAVKPTAVVNPLGAGDAYVGAFLSAMLKGYSLIKCARLASVVSSFVVESESAQAKVLSRKLIGRRYSEEFEDSTFP